MKTFSNVFMVRAPKIHFGGIKKLLFYLATFIDKPRYFKFHSFIHYVKTK